MVGRESDGVGSSTAHGIATRRSILDIGGVVRGVFDNAHNEVYKVFLIAVSIVSLSLLHFAGILYRLPEGIIRLVDLQAFVSVNWYFVMCLSVSGAAFRLGYVFAFAIQGFFDFLTFKFLNGWIGRKKNKSYVIRSPSFQRLMRLRGWRRATKMSPFTRLLQVCMAGFVFAYLYLDFPTDETSNLFGNAALLIFYVFLILAASLRLGKKASYANFVSTGAGINLVIALSLTIAFFFGLNRSDRLMSRGIVSGLIGSEAISYSPYLSTSNGYIVFFSGDKTFGFVPSSNMLLSSHGVIARR